MVQLDAMKVMLVMSHSDNTFNKEGLKKSNSPFVKLLSTTLVKIRNFIKDPKLREFYSSL